MPAPFGMTPRAAKRRRGRSWQVAEELVGAPATDHADAVAVDARAQ
jgi:hypothetical protein